MAETPRAHDRRPPYRAHRDTQTWSNRVLELRTSGGGSAIAVTLCGHVASVYTCLTCQCYQAFIFARRARTHTCQVPSALSAHCSSASLHTAGCIKKESFATGPLCTQDPAHPATSTTGTGLGPRRMRQLLSRSRAHAEPAPIPSPSRGVRFYLFRSTV